MPRHPALFTLDAFLLVCGLTQQFTLVRGVWLVRGEVVGLKITGILLMADVISALAYIAAVALSK